MEHLYKDIYLKFPDEETAQAAVFDGFNPRYTAVDMVGEIAGVSGWHVNMRVRPDEDASALDAYKIPTPNNPKRVFA